MLDYELSVSASFRIHTSVKKRFRYFVAMNDEEIFKLFEASFPELNGYNDAVKSVLEVLVSVNEPISFALMARVLETDPASLESPLEALDELVRVEDGDVSLFSPECIDWLCDPDRKSTRLNSSH